MNSHYGRNNIRRILAMLQRKSISPSSDEQSSALIALATSTGPRLVSPDQAYCDEGTVNSAGRLKLVIESARPDTSTFGIPLIVLMLTAHEGRLAINTAGQHGSSMPRDCRGVALCVQTVEPGSAAGVKTGGNAPVLNQR